MMVGVYFVLLVFITLFSANLCLDDPSQNGTLFSFLKSSQIITEFRYLNTSGYSLLPVNNCVGDPLETVCTFDFKPVANTLLVSTDQFIAYNGDTIIDYWTMGINRYYFDPIPDISTETQNLIMPIYFTQVAPNQNIYITIKQNDITKSITLKNEVPNENVLYRITNFPAGSGTGILRLTNGFERTFNHQQPQIESISYTLSTVTITGKNFFTWINQTSIWVNTALFPSANIISVEQRQIIINRNNNAVGIYDFKVAVSGINSEVKSLGILPIVTSVTTCLKTGGLVTISGEFLFAKKPNGDPTNINIQIGNIATITSATGPSTGDPTFLVFTMPAGDQDYQLVTVTIDGVENRPHTVEFSFEVPSIKNIKQEGKRLILTGTSLLSKSLLINSAGTSLGNLTLIDSESAYIDLPPNIKDDSFYVQTDKKISNSESFVFTPLLSSISSGSTAGGSVITIYGYFLMLKNPSLVSVDNTLVCSDFTEGDGSYLTCIISKGVGKDHPMTLIIDSTTMSGVFSFNPPVIDSFIQNYDQFTITGQNFGLYNNATTIYFDGNSFTPSFESTDSLIFKIPTTSHPGPVYVKVADQNSLERDIVIGPAIQNVVFSNGGNEISSFSDRDSFGNPKPLFTKQNISLHGMFFYRNVPFEVTLKNSKRILPCNNATIVDDQESVISCTAPWSSGTGYTFSIKAGNVFFTLPQPFNYQKPIITNTTTVSDMGGIITIFGSGFAPQSGQMSVYIDTFKCIDPYGTSSETLECFMPKFEKSDEVPRNNLTIYLEVDGQLTSLENGFAFNVTALPQQNQEKAPKATWLVAAILVPCLVAILATVIVAVIVVNRYKKLKVIQKELGP